MTELLEAALNAITERTNLETGLTHPNDTSAAKEMFQRLHQAGEGLQANEINAWAVKHGWKRKDANELGELAQKIGKGKRVRITDGHWWNDDVLDTLLKGSE